MIYIAKMVTRYPEFHGSGYYNFLVAESREELDEKIEDNSHDFTLDKVVKTRHNSFEPIKVKYPNKQDLNAKYFATI